MSEPIHDHPVPIEGCWRCDLKARLICMRHELDTTTETTPEETPMTEMSMTPIPIPPEAAASRPHLRALRIGPPPGVSDDDCGTVESLTGVQDGYQVFADYWRPTPEQLEALAAGGFIELIQYAPRMVMHSMTVWDVPAADGEADA